jgi:hypothetical protein
VKGKAGSYKLILDIAGDLREPRPDVVVDGKRLAQGVAAMSKDGVSISQPIHIANESGLTSIEITPPEPFIKGTPLPKKVLSLRLVRVEN